jgi:hypothetical protein
VDGVRRAARRRATLGAVLPLVFTRAEALRAGFDIPTINARVRRGDWTCLRRGVYAETARLPAAPAARHAADVAAAVRATRQDVVGSHESAAVVHELTTFTRYDGPPTLSRLREPRQCRPDGTSVAGLVSHVPPHHRTELLGAAVTTAARTAVDLARKGPSLSAVVVLDSALRRDVPRAELEEVLRVARGWPGSRTAAQLVAFADGRAESALESVGRYRMWQLGLPKPELQIPLYDALGLMGYPDFVWEDLRVIAEADGLLKYRTDDPDAPPDLRDRDALALEKQREDRFRDAGYEVFRFTWEIAVHRTVVLEQRAQRAFARARLRWNAA